MASYEEFVAGKHAVQPSCGIVDIHELSPRLFPFQRDAVAWALRKGRAAVFFDTGLGKSFVAMEWLRVVAAHTGKPCLLLAPLAVSRQFAREAAKFGIEARIVTEASEVGPGINITNYHKLHKFDALVFGGVALDESSIMKDHTASTRQILIDAFRETPFRLALTATPSPNDHSELGNHAEFLGVMTRTEMLAMFFVHDGETTQEWRIKGHAKSAFWKWCASWAITLRKPSDIGYDDAGYDLPPLTYHYHVIPAEQSDTFASGRLFAEDALTLSEQRAARKSSLARRVEMSAKIANETVGPCLVWCDLNVEGDELEKAIEGAVQVAGADPDEVKEHAILWFNGDECTCSSAIFRSKLAECRSRKIPNTSENTTVKTEKSGSLHPSNTDASTGTSARSISPITTPRTSKNTSSIPSSAPQSMPREELDTRSTKNSEKKSSRSRRTGIMPIRKNDSTSGCESTESQQTSTTECSPISEVDARFADEPNQVIGAVAECMSITLTLQASFVGCSARTVTWGSASSETTPTDSIELRCTCGHQSGHRVLISKISIFGFGLNLQACSTIVFCGVTHSWEQFYQAIRRCWRFGQQNEVHVHIVSSETEGRVVRNLQRKQSEATAMGDAMVNAMSEISRAELRGTERTTDNYNPSKAMVVASWLVSEVAS